MSKREPVHLLEDILQSVENIFKYTENSTYNDFVSNPMMIDAVVIGEAANRLPDEYKDQCPQIDWYKIRGLRNRIVHHYFGIDHGIIWKIKENFLPDLIVSIHALLNQH